MPSVFSFVVVFFMLALYCCPSVCCGLVSIPLLVLFCFQLLLVLLCLCSCGFLLYVAFPPLVCLIPWVVV
jgi:hypothetical protein